jgi:superfamily II DNA or RNA helicase
MDFSKLNTYLGQKGYTISKKDLSTTQIDDIKKELTIKPYVPGAPNNSGQNTFPGYRESGNKIYMPRYFGETHFGPPKEIKISEGTDINVEFGGVLRDNQIPVVEKYIKHVTSKQTAGGLLELPCGFGKTSLSLYIASKLKKKTLVIVHKEFLMNQWIERIQQFIPNARIGKIQGQIIDIEDKDIVLGMLQSLSMKDYPSSLFDSFGLTIIDEVHHISSEVFSNVLFKLVTKYMMGLSATMNRKDGTTNVFKMFLGEVIYKNVEKGQHNVLVRGIRYIANDADFNETEYDYRGNPKYSTMISKLCLFSPRTEFILKIMTDMLVENPQQQIIVLAHNKSILKYLYDAICHRNIATVGYYIGGMKEAALKESETKTIIIATFSMAAEALDIKSLTTLIMATPKTEIEQAVGRILRAKHSQPIVVDIIDSHEPFHKQWLKRKAFYKKQNYKIVECSNKSDEYNVWTTINEHKEEQLEQTGKCLIKLNKKLVDQK